MSSAGVLQRAREASAMGDVAGGYRHLAHAVDLAETFGDWQALTHCLEELESQQPQPAARTARVAVVGTYTSSQLVRLLRVGAFRYRVDTRVYEGPYAQAEQEILDPTSRLYAFDPDIVVIAPHAGALHLQSYSTVPTHDVEMEAKRWTSLWETVAARSRARIVQHNFACPPVRPFGHLSPRLAGSRARMVGAVNDALADAAGDQVAIVDCAWLSSLVGTQAWFDDRYWHLAKQAVAVPCLPLLAQHTAAVIAAQLGLSRKCVVVDADDTLWGGIVGEEGLAGIRIGDGPIGEAYTAFQEYLLDLEQRGVLLAVCSKNNEADVVEVFEQHPEMRVRMRNIAALVANWDPKPDNLRRIADVLGIGLDALVFVDDNAAECDVVRQLTPEVEIVELPADPADYRSALARCLALEPASFTSEDSARTAQYKARAHASELERSTTSLEEFWRSLEMRATVAPVDHLHLRRVVQLIGKTNQFNLTTPRYGVTEVEAMLADPDYVCLYLRLEDRFADHGLVGVLIARQAGDALDIDTWLMSCRVIGRSADAEMLMHLCQHAPARGCTRLLGTYIPTAKNALVATLYADFGFACVGEEADGTTRWEYDIASRGPIHNEFCGNG